MALQLEGMCPLIQVFDMPTSIAFYRDVVGFEVVDSEPAGDDCDWAWLRLNDAELMLNTRNEKPHRPPAPDPARTAGHRDTCLYFGCRDVDAAYEYLVGKGVEMDPPKTAPYGMRQLYVRDPDGYNLCFQWSVDASNSPSDDARAS
ncbi:MAG: VOC family protein [Gemmatimonadota bacterium]|nr:VOC family protein [Gemmatimonadota bacterium]